MTFHIRNLGSRSFLQRLFVYLFWFKIACTFQANAQIAFHTEILSRQILLNSTFMVTVHLDGLKAGNTINAWTEGGRQIIEFTEVTKDNDSGYFAWLDRDTLWKTEVNDSMVVFLIKAQTAGEHNHTLHIDVDQGKKQIYRWSRAVSFTVENPVVCIQPVQWPVIYELVDNPLKIAVSGLAASEMIVSANVGSLRKNSEGYVLNPGSRIRNKQVTLKIVGRTADGNILVLDDQSFPVFPIPEPELIFSLPDSTDANGSLKLSHPILTPNRLSIQSWDLEVRISGKIRTAHGVGDTLNKEALRLLTQLKPGDTWLLKNVTVNLDGKESRWVLARQGLVSQTGP